MSEEDQDRWDKKWSALAAKTFRPHRLLGEHAQLLSGGTALDLACGPGQNAVWLAGYGYRVIGVDISRVALRKARDSAIDQGVADNILFVNADLDHWPLPVDALNLICVFRFLDRSLYPAIRAALRPDGLLFYSTRHFGIRHRDPDANPDYLLAPGELEDVFGDWSILHYREGSENADLIAQKQQN